VISTPNKPTPIDAMPSARMSGLSPDIRTVAAMTPKVKMPTPTIARQIQPTVT
jgi:hypothetical protein